MALKTVIYIRKSSTDADEKQKYSFDRQKEDIESYLEKNAKSEEGEGLLKYDWKVATYFEDHTAKGPGRKEFELMIREIRKHKYDVLLCHELSRLSRNAVDNGQLVQLLEEGYLREIRTLDKIFYNTPTDKFTLNLFLSVAKYENDQRGLNTKSGMKSRKNAGATTHKAAFGYINDPQAKQVVEDGDNFQKVRELWDLYLTGEYSYKDIYKHALAIGVP